VLSFGTVRWAMKVLREQNLIETRWGRGNYVAAQVVKSLRHPEPYN
jgi:DNA-binding GntR family transcriptional regulator